MAAVLAYSFELAKVDVVGPGSGRGTSSAETAMSLREPACCSSSEISYIAAYKPNEPNQNYSALSALSELVWDGVEHKIDIDINGERGDQSGGTI